MICSILKWICKVHLQDLIKFKEVMLVQKAFLKFSPLIYMSKHEATIQRQELLKSWRSSDEHQMELMKVRFVLCLNDPEEDLLSL